jgi:hypothetical protein
MNQKYQVIIQPAAQKAIEEAYFWLSNHSSLKARTWLEGLYKATLAPQLMLVGSEWTRILHNRILNGDYACCLYRDILHSLNSQEPNFVRQLLEESASYHFNKREKKLELAR